MSVPEQGPAVHSSGPPQVSVLEYSVPSTSVAVIRYRFRVSLAGVEASASGSVLHRRPAEDCGDTERQLAMTSLDSFGSRATLDVAGKSYTIYRLDALSQASKGNSDKLPFSLN